MCGADLFLAILAILFPPIAVWIKVGVCTADSIINIALCCLGYLPGLLHAWYIIMKYPEPEDYPEGYEPLDVEGSRRVTYYYVSRQPGEQRPMNRSYGTADTQTSPPQVPSGTRPTEQNSQPEAGTSSNAAPSGSHAPPTYAEAVRGDNKVQTQD